MTPEEIDNLLAELDAANDCCVEILQSYKEFAELMIRCAMGYNAPTVRGYARGAIDRWKPILDRCLQRQKDR